MMFQIRSKRIVGHIDVMAKVLLVNAVTGEVETGPKPLVR
jgi:hypothetical protein